MVVLLFQGISVDKVEIRNAYLISLLTGRKQTLVANVHGIENGGYFPVDKVDIPPKAPVQLELLIEPGLSFDSFLKEWGSYRFVIEYNDGTTFQKAFDESYIKERLRQEVPSAFGPRVTPKGK